MNFAALGGTRLLSDSILYGISNIFQKSFSFLIIFLLSKNLSVENYGLIDFILSLISLLAIIIIFGQDYAVARFFNQEANIYKKKLLISQSLMIHLIQIILFLPIFFLIIHFLKKKLFLSLSDLNIVLFSLFTLISIVIINFCQIIHKYSFRREMFILISFAQGFLFFISIIYLVNYSILNIEYILFFYLIVNLFVLIISILSIKNWLIFSKKILSINNNLIKYGISFGLVSLITSASMIFERFFVLQLLSSYHLGIYSLALKIGIIVQIIMHSILSGWEPYFLSNLKKKKININLNLMLKICFFLSLALVFFFNTFSETIILFLANDQYIEAKNYVLPIIAAVAFQELSRITSSGILVTKKVYWFTVMHFVCFLILLLVISYSKDFISLKIIVSIVCFNNFLKFIMFSFISNYISRIKLNIIELTSILIIYLNVFLIIYHINVFDFDELLKFLISFIILGGVLIFYLNKNELSISKKILINFIKY